MRHQEEQSARIDLLHQTLYISHVRHLLMSLLLSLKNQKGNIMIRINWNKVAKWLKIAATVITTIVGTIAVQSCY
jgi:hypothetical protein